MEIRSEFFGIFNFKIIILKFDSMNIYEAAVFANDFSKWLDLGLNIEYNNLKNIILISNATTNAY